MAAIGAPLALYAAFAVASGVKSGIVYNLVVLLCGMLALVLPVVAVTALLAPDSGFTRRDAPRQEAPIETLKRRYAAGELDREEFDRRLDDLIRTSENTLERETVDRDVDRPPGDGDVEPASR